MPGHAPRPWPEPAQIYGFRHPSNRGLPPFQFTLQEIYNLTNEHIRLMKGWEDNECDPIDNE